ncbi:hypothetical protein QBC47DRAFT_90976 [Echria macrotheca]|uniref:FAR1 domain-containing protein n=1 Tax=Echria macrotheca TaxID=438768 RepID=A0AAJ0B783_9PEZI|nr:hypothetical protein QBC47DRAFT_90976 [Echria macrotheca]
MDTHQSQPRQRKRQRPAAAPGPNVPAGHAAVPQQAWGTAHPVAVRAVAGDTVSVPPPPTTGFPSQQLDRSHQVEPDSLMNGYSAAQQHPYPDTQSSLGATGQNDLGSLNGGLSSITGDASNPNQHHGHAHQHHLHPPPPSQQQTSQQHQQQRPSAATANKTDRVLFPYGPPQSTHDSPPATVASSTPQGQFNLWQTGGPAASSSSMPPKSPANKLAPPPEGIYGSFEDLLNAAQQVAKDQGYGIVKLRASNYRDGKPTRYDLVCDRGGVKYNSTAKKRNPSTRKIDCPWRAKAVCEVNLGNQWRFAVQESRHNHEARMPAAAPGQENAPMNQSLRSLTHRVERIAHDMTASFERIDARMDHFEKRFDALFDAIQGRNMMGANGVQMGASNMPTANMGGATLGNVPLSNGGMGGGGMMDGRMSGMEARVSGMEPRGNGMDTLPMMDNDAGQLAMMVNP